MYDQPNVETRTEFPQLKDSDKDVSFLSLEEVHQHCTHRTTKRGNDRRGFMAGKPVAGVLGSI